MGYRETIVEDTGCDQQDAGVVEGIMRSNNGGLLDGLRKPAFKREARKAYRLVQVLKEGKEDPVRIAKEIGFTVEELNQDIEFVFNMNSGY